MRVYQFLSTIIFISMTACSAGQVSSSISSLGSSVSASATATPSPTATPVPTPTPTPTPGAPSAPTSISMFNPSINSGTTGTPTVTVGGVTSGNTVYVYLDSNTCVGASGSAVASGTTVNVTMPTVGMYGVGHVLYARQITPGGLNSACSTASITYYYVVPTAPTSLSVSIPAANSGMSSTPTITVGGVLNNTRVYLYADSSCTTILVSGTNVSGSSIDLLSPVRPPGASTFYAKQSFTGYSYYSACSTASVTYTYLPPAAPTSLTMFLPQTTTGTMLNPVISISGVIDGNTVTLYSNSTCTVSRGSTVANSGANITSSAVSVGATTFYAKQARADGSISSCSTANVTYTYSAPTPTPTPSVVVSQASAGLETTCVVTSAGKLKCWGRNSNNELRDGTTTPSSVPVDIPGFETGVTAVASGNGVICAIQSGALKCWGNISSGLAYAYPSIRTLGTDSFTKLAFTHAHVCAITTTGAARCFGNSMGFKTITTGLDSGVTAVSVGNEFSCAVQNGALKCWGCNYSDLTILNTGTNTCNIPTQVLGLESGVTAVSITGDSLICAIQNGALKCWSFMYSGGFGSTPTVIPGFESGVTYTQGKCALKNGDYRCYSTNSIPSGVIDVQSTSVGGNIYSSYGLGVYGVKALIVGEQISTSLHNCYLFNSGEFKCSGGNSNGQLGNGTFVDSTSLVSPVGF